MSLPVELVDGRGSQQKVCVTSIGQLVVASISYDETSFQELSTIDTAFNFYEPEAGKQFVITGIYAIGSKSISQTEGATVVFYEADNTSTLTEDRVIFETVMIRDQSQLLTPLNILVGEGKFINGKTTSDSVNTTITGYFIDKLE